MKRTLALVMAAALLALVPLCALAESDPPLSTDGWGYIGYIYGGVALAVPPDYESYEIDETFAAYGCVLLGGNADFMLQMRVFQEDDLTYDDFKEMIEQERAAEISTRMDGDSEILLYRNTKPSASSELYGIALTGLDGLFYKISIFTGADEAFGDDAPVWSIAEAIGQTVMHQDFSEWGVEGAPDFA